MKIVIFCDFLHFLNFDDAIDYLAGADRKCALWLDMCPLDPRDTSTYTGCHVMLSFLARKRRFVDREGGKALPPRRMS